jgi:hypothetical protein
MDADIILNKADTLELVLASSTANPHLDGASDCPIKSIAGKAHPTARERLSLAGRT